MNVNGKTPKFEQQPRIGKLSDYRITKKKSIKIFEVIKDIYEHSDIYKKINGKNPLNLKDEILLAYMDQISKIESFNHIEKKFRFEYVNIYSLLRIRLAEQGYKLIDDVIEELISHYSNSNTKCPWSIIQIKSETNKIVRSLVMRS